MERTDEAIDHLFPKIRQRILASTLLAPDRAWHLRQLARQVDATPSSLQRELAGLVAVGILTRAQDGNRVAFRANEQSPLFPELQGLMRKSLGAADLLRTALESLEGIESAFVYGSFARSEAVTSKSDIDLMVVGDVSGVALATALQAVEREVGREVNPTVYTRKELEERIARGNHFLATVARTERLPLIGDVDVLATLA